MTSGTTRYVRSPTTVSQPITIHWRCASTSVISTTVGPYLHVTSMHLIDSSAGKIQHMP